MITGYAASTMLKHENSLANFTSSGKIEIDDTGWWGFLVMCMTLFVRLS